MTESLEPQPQGHQNPRQESNEKLSQIIFVADDEASLRRLNVGILSREGYEVRTAENGKDLLDQIRRQKPNIVISDNNMPIMSGLEVLEQIDIDADPNLKGLPFILYTTDTDKDGQLEETVRKLGGVFLAKPAGRDVLTALVKKLLEESKE